MTTANAAEQPVTARGNLLARHPLTFYFAIVFSWLLLLPGVLTFYGVLGLSPPLVSMMAIASLLGPILSGFFMTALTEGGAGVGRLLQRIVRWRVGVQWYLFVLVGIPAAVALCTIFWPGALASFDVSAHPFSLAYLSAFVSMVVIGGPLFEEPGWTGFAQPRLQRLHGPWSGASSCRIHPVPGGEPEREPLGDGVGQRAVESRTGRPRRLRCVAAC